MFTNPPFSDARKFRKLTFMSQVWRVPQIRERIDQCIAEIGEVQGQYSSAYVEAAMV